MTDGVRINVRTEGIQRALRGLDKVSVTRALTIAVSTTQQAVRKRIATYPRQTEANMPKPYPGRWYQRLWGPRWALKGGGTGGRNTSEQLQYSWVRRIVSPLTQIVETRSPKTGRPVSYDIYVHGAQEQVAVHRRHGWPTDEQIADEVSRDPRVEAEIMAAIDRVLK